MKRWILFSFVLPSFCFSQKTTIDRPEKLIEPNPYQAAYFQDFNNYENVKSVGIIVKGKWSEFRPDTLSIEDYEAGKKVFQTKFSKNNRNSTISYHYNGDGSLRSWKLKSEKSTPLHAYYSHDSLQRISEIVQYNIGKNKADSSLSSKTTATYSGKSISEIRSHTFSISDRYKYSNGRLDSKSNGLGTSKFKYDDNGNLIKIVDFFGKPELNDITGVKYFRYNNQNQLIGDSISTGNDYHAGTFQITTYEYDGDVLKSVNVKHSHRYRDIEFNCKNGKIQEVIVKTNSERNPHLRHWLHYKLYDYLFSEEIIWVEKFEYDQHGNRTAKKCFVNDELFVETEYIISY